MAQPAPPRYARVVVDVAPAHLDRPFDYRIPEGLEPTLGSRVRVDFAGRRRIGWVVDVVAAPEVDDERIRPLITVDGAVTWFDAQDLTLYRWVADRWAGSLADVLRHALPRRVASEELREPAPARGAAPAGATPAGADWSPYGAEALLSAFDRPLRPGAGPAYWLRALPSHDPALLGADLVRRCLAAGRSALVLAGDPAAPLPAAAMAVAGAAGADLRGASDRQRYRAFLDGRAGRVRVVVGERGAVLAPLRDLGLILVDDEANPGYKERRAPRHNARDVALARARMAGAACVLFGDLPSAALYRLLEEGHVLPVAAARGDERAAAPRVTVVDRSDPRPGASRARLSDQATRALARSVRDGGAAVVVAARGGAGAALACQGCRARLACPVCAGSVRTRRGDDRWECPACGWDGPPFACPFCGGERSAPLAAGAGRLAQELTRSHPAAEVARMEGFDAPGPTGRPAIAVMTRGSVVRRPAWLGDRPADAVVLPDADAFLARPEYDAAEDALRLMFALARWAVGGGELILQTREPAHPAIQALLRWDPLGFWEREAPRRAELRYPPAAWLIAVRAPAADAPEVIAELRERLPEGDEVLGPDEAGAALVKTSHLRGTLAAIAPLRDRWSKADRKVRIDVDPVL